jgi:protein-arginine kinase activator protein McsA
MGTFGIGSMGQDDGYQGPRGESKLSEKDEEMANLSFQIARLEDQAQNAEDREQLSKASTIRSRIRPLVARLNDLKKAP